MNGSPGSKGGHPSSSKLPFVNFANLSPSHLHPPSNGVSPKKAKLESNANAPQADPTPSSSSPSSRANVDPRITESRAKLPIWIARDAIVDAVKQNDTVVVLGETGSGKTTQIPRFLYDAGLSGSYKRTGGKRRRQMIGITQPRRVAAISLAKRVAVELGVPEPDRDAKAHQREARQIGAPNDGSSALVGYSVRFDDRSSHETAIKFMTDGWLLRELLSGPSRKGKDRSKPLEEEAGNDQEELRFSLLEQYSVIVIDEAHERSVHTDVVLGLVKRVQRERKKLRQAWLKRKADGSSVNEQADLEPTELKVVVMSATIDAEAFARFYSTPQHEPAPILYIKGRQFPIQMFHAAETCLDWVESCKKLIVQINITMAPGDVLVFMTGAEDIESFASELHELNKGMKLYAEGMGRAPSSDLVVVKLYAALGGEAIRKCFAATPPGCRKVVLATNIAETSITISGIKYVIDCGLAKERSFQSSMADEHGTSAIAGASTEMLSVNPISKAAARQRSGRAGRESGGSCFRLYTSDTFDTLPDSTLPEILRTDLSSVVLDVFAMGLNPLTFDWLDRPEDEGWRAAVLNLTELGALEPIRVASQPDDESDKPARRQAGFRLTALGRQMSKLPLLPALSKTLLTAREFDESGRVFMQALDLVSILSTERRTILIEPSVRIDDGSGQVKGGTSKREEADRARERLAHPSGDHATQLQAMYAFGEMESSCRTKDNNGGSKGTANGTSLSNGARSYIDIARLKEWCNVNYVSLKAVREAKRIRAQLLQVCKRERWIAAEAGEAVGAVNGHADLPSESESEQSDEGMLVTRGSGSLFGQMHVEERAREDYSALRRCLIQGKRLNTALRQGQSRTYQRAHGGQAVFRIHPSSTLLLTSSSNLPTIIYFEDMVYTSQLFARTVSAAEPSWLTDMNAELRNRRALQH